MCAIRPLPPARLAAVLPASLAFQDELHTEVHLPAPTYVVVRLHAWSATRTAYK